MDNEDFSEQRNARLTRTDGLSKRLGHISQGMPNHLSKARLALTNGIAIAAITLMAATSLSVVVHAKKLPHFVPRATGPMPAVNAP
jgi:hypothetical protein